MISDLIKQRDEEMETIAVLRTELGDKEKNSTNLAQELQQQMKSVQLELKAKEQEREQLEKSLIQETSKRKTIQEHLNSHSSEVKRQLEEKDNELVTMQERLQTREMQLEQMSQEKRNLSQVLLSSQDSLQQLARELKKAMSVLNKNMETMDGQTQHLEQRFLNLQQKLSHHVSLIDYWRGNAEQTQNTLGSLQENMHETKTILDNIKKERDQLEVDNKRLENQCLKLEVEKTQQENNINLLQKVSVVAVDKVIISKQELASSQSNTETTRQTNSITVQMLQKEKQRLEQELEIMKTQLKEKVIIYINNNCVCY